MSLKEAYTLAHSAQCRLQLEAGRPDRNLRFVVGHLMHYENLRLRIVQIEHDISSSQRASSNLAFKGTGHVGKGTGGGLRHKPSTGQLGRRSPPPQKVEYENEDEDEDSDEDDDMLIGMDDDEEEGLGLQRFPSGTARPPPELMPDDEDDDDEEPNSPEEPSQEALEQAMKGEGSTELGGLYEGVRRCPCHGHTAAPKLGRMWELPGQESSGTGKNGVKWAVAEVGVEA
ncbi:hypothetical protein LTR10_003375 [Elasticomyces elasticus]|nr:hypothetical protein LTR10_003375 [Elasticomyces elasticus]KAK4969643.1 hypothetical protein LTR42_008915 [Elasticomyces elasticus]